MSKRLRIVVGERMRKEGILGRVERTNTATVSRESSVHVPCAHELLEGIDEHRGQATQVITVCAMLERALI